MDISNHAVTFVQGRNALDLEDKLNSVRLITGKRVDVLNISTSAPWIAWFYTDQTKIPLQSRVKVQQEIAKKKTRKKKVKSK